MSITTLLIDDEELARALVKKYMETETDFSIVGEAADGFEALKQIQTLQPQLLILDIQMPKITGLEMLQVLENPPLVIFSTAYDQYAIQAFEAKAVDYLLKPFDKKRFLAALDRIRALVAAQHTQLQPQAKELLDETKTERLVVKNGNKIEVIAKEQVLMIEAYGDYVWIHTQEGKYIKQQTLKSLEAQFEEGFVRIHRSTLVNIDNIKKLERYEKNSYRLMLKNGLTLSVSKTGYKELKERLRW
jgi:two-component system LytT family response regulator